MRRSQVQALVGASLQRRYQLLFDFLRQFTTFPVDNNFLWLPLLINQVATIQPAFMVPFPHDPFKNRLGFINRQCSFPQINCLTLSFGGFSSVERQYWINSQIVFGNWDDPSASLLIACRSCSCGLFLTLTRLISPLLLSRITFKNNIVHQKARPQT